MKIEDENSGWIQTTLGKQVFFLDNKRVPIKQHDRAKRQGIFPYYGASGIIDYIDDYLFDDELILLAEDGANIISRSTPIAFRVSGKIWVNNHAHVLKAKDSIDIDYLCFYLEFLNYEKYNTSSTQPKLNRETCENIPLIFPTLTEQKAIVSILETWDTAIEKTERLIAAKEKHFKYLLKTLISDQQNNPEWGSEYLSKLVVIKKGEQLNRNNLTKIGTYPAWNGGITPSGYTDRWNTHKNTITISEGGNSCGFVNHCKQDFWCGGHCYALINVDKKINNEYLYYFLKTYEKSIMNLRVGSGLPNIQKRNIDKFQTCYPVLKKQKNIAHVFNTAKQEITTLQNLAEKYRTQKRGLMQKLLKGA